LLKRRRQESVVDDHERAGRARTLSDDANVGDAQQRIARRFDPHETRPPRGDQIERGWSGEIGKHDLEVATFRQPSQQALRAAVAIMRCDAHITRIEQLHGQRHG
jgi:hypothetical protein